MMKIKRIRLKQENIIIIISIVLSLFCLIYLTKGFYYLIIDDKIGAEDLYSRWQEQQYIYRGLYPYDVRKGSPLIDPELGSVTSGMYPPWAFFTGFIVFPPITFQLTRWYHALLNTISLVVLAVFSYQVGLPYGRLKAWFSVITCLSISSHYNTLRSGQYGIIINALLICTFWLIQKHRDILAGLLFGLALAKPNISGLFLLILIIRQRTKAFLACVIYILFASLAIWILTTVSPLYMLTKMIKTSKYFVQTGYSGINVLINFGCEPMIATILLALVSTGLLVAILYFCRHYSLLTLFATAAVVGRVWTYHLAYDNVMLIFLLLAHLNLALGKANKANKLIFILLLISLLIPTSAIVKLDYVPLTQFTIWISAEIYLLIQEKRTRANERIS